LKNGRQSALNLYTYNICVCRIRDELGCIPNWKKIYTIVAVSTALVYNIVVYKFLLVRTRKLNWTAYASHNMFFWKFWHNMVSDKLTSVWVVCAWQSVYTRAPKIRYGDTILLFIMINCVWNFYIYYYHHHHCDVFVGFLTSCDAIRFISFARPQTKIL